MQKEQQKKIIIIAIIALFFIIPVTLYIINLGKSVAINIKYSPTSAVFTLNGQQYQSGEYKIRPGTYEISIKKDGFQTVTQTLTFNSGDNKKIYYCLEETEDTGWYITHQDDYNICYNIKEYLAEEAQQAKFDSEEIFQYTPYHDYRAGFRIDPYFNEDDQVVVNITLTTCQDSKMEELKTAAMDWLKSKNLNLEKYEFVYQKDC